MLGDSPLQQTEFLGVIGGTLLSRRLFFSVRPGNGTGVFDIDASPTSWCSNNTTSHHKPRFVLCTAPVSLCISGVTCLAWSCACHAVAARAARGPVCAALLVLPNSPCDF